MSFTARLRGWLRRDAPAAIRVHVVIKGRIGDGWCEVDERIALPAHATLATLIDEADRRGLRLGHALEHSPHLRHTLMWNGQRAPLEQNLERPLHDGDEVYLLGPLAGG